MARSTGDGPSTASAPDASRGGWAMNRGWVPRWPACAECTTNGWQSYTSPARPVTVTTSRCADAASASAASSKNSRPAAPAGASNGTTSRCAGARPDVDDQLVAPQCEAIEESVNDPRVGQEVLPVRAPSAVPIGPSASGAHGGGAS